MKKLLFLLFAMCISISSWGYAIGEKVKPVKAWVVQMDNSGNFIGTQISTAAGDVAFSGVKIKGTEVASKDLAGWEFEVVSNDDQLLTLRVYKCDTGILGTDVVVPSVVQDERNSIFFVTHSGGANYADNIYQNATSVTFSEGMIMLEYACFRQCPNLKSIHFPSTLAALGNTGWLGNMMFENKKTCSLAEITVHPLNQYFKTNTEANDQATNSRINKKTGGKNVIGSKVDLKTYPNTQLLSKDGKTLFLCATNYLDSSGNPQPMRMIRIADGVETLAQPENQGNGKNQYDGDLGCNQFVFGPNVYYNNTSYYSASNRTHMQNRLANASCEMFFPNSYQGVKVAEEVMDEDDNTINGYYTGQSWLGKRCHESQVGYITGYYVDPLSTYAYSKDGIVYMDYKDDNGNTAKILLRYPSIKSYPYSDGTNYQSPMVGLDGVNMIWDDACNSCYMTHVTVPNSDWFIGYEAFEYCQFLKQVDIPASVNHIRQAAFSACLSLENIFVDKNNMWYSNCFHNGNTSDGVLYKLEDDKHTMLMCYPAGKTPEGNTKANPYKLCDDVKYVANMAFGNCWLLNYIDLNNAERLNYRAFYSCSNLKEIKLTNKVKKVGTGCFQLCI